MAFFIGGRQRGRYFIDGSFYVWALWWLNGASGGLIFLIWLAPYLAAILRWAFI